jgi:predicted DNA binding CopG/RHH family protein
VKASDGKKENVILIRMSKKEARLIKKQARSLGLSVSAYVRMLINLEDKK